MPSTILFLANFDFDLKLNMTVGRDFASHVSRCMNDQVEMQPENVFRPWPTSKSEFVTTQSREIKLRIPHIFFLQRIMSVCMIMCHKSSYYL